MSHDHVLLGSREVPQVAEDTRALPAPPSFMIDTSNIQILDQGQWGSCAAFATRYAYLLWQQRTSQEETNPSVAFWYARARLSPTSTAKLSDNGTSLSSVVSVLSTLGAPPEEAWPYTSQKIFSKPPQTLTGPVCTVPVRIPRLGTWQLQSAALKAVIASGRAIMVGIQVYANGVTTQVMVSGDFPMPAGRRQGGHAVCIVGYNGDVFTIVNSWGAYNGVNGFFTIPAQYVANANYAGEWFAF